MASNSVLTTLVAMMLLTGVANTILTKYQDMQCVRNCDSPDPKKREYFQQPVIQTAQMFIGEMGSWLIVAAYAIFRRQSGRSTKSGYEPVVGDAQSDRSATPDVGRSDAVDGEEYSDAVDRAVTVVKPLVDGRHGHAELEPLRGIMTAVIAVPACCDIAGTTLMNIGLLFVAASIYQMTRGALVIFTGLLSVLFLRRRLASYKWAGLFIVVAGVAIVGLAGAVARDHKAVPGSGTSADGYGHGIKEDIQLHARSVMETLGNALRHRSMESREAEKTPLAVQTLIGVFLIACAQIFTAAQFVVEERIMERYSIGPLQMVGWEGTFGFTVTLVGMIVLHLIIGRTPAGQYGYFDLQEGLRELSENRAIGLSSVLIMISIGSFNFFGLSVTRDLSATARATIDTSRTLFIWLVSLGLGWETFKWLEVAGFVLLVYGTFLVNDIVAPPRSCFGRSARAQLDETVPESPIEHH